MVPFQGNTTLCHDVDALRTPPCVTGVWSLIGRRQSYNVTWSISVYKGACIRRHQPFLSSGSACLKCVHVKMSPVNVSLGPVKSVCITLPWRCCTQALVYESRASADSSWGSCICTHCVELQWGSSALAWYFSWGIRIEHLLLAFWTLCLPRQCGGLIVGTADKLVDVFDKGVPLYQAFQDSSIAGEACWVAQSTWMRA